MRVLSAASVKLQKFAYPLLVLGIIGFAIIIRVNYGSKFICLIEVGSYDPTSCAIVILIIPILILSLILYVIYKIMVIQGRISEDRIYSHREGISRYFYFLEYYPVYHISLQILILVSLLLIELLYGVDLFDQFWAIVFDGIGGLILARSYGSTVGPNYRKKGATAFGYVFLAFGIILHAWILFPWQSI